MASRNPEPLDDVRRWMASPLAAPPRPPPLAEALAARVRMILETRPGTLPWLPGYGCDLSDVVGQPATADAVSLVGRRVSEALSRWLPEVLLLRCEPRLVTSLGVTGGARDRAVPVAEGALVPFSLSAAVEVELELQTVAGLLSLQARVTP